MNGNAAASCSLSRVYEQLGEYQVAGHVGNNLLPVRTIQIIDALLRSRKSYLTSRYPDWP